MPAAADPNAVRHRWIELDGQRIFYREAGREDAPVLLLPHGYPCSSYEFRNLMPRLADRWRLLAPDFPGFGYSDTPAEADFDSYADFLERFVTALGIDRFTLYLHDYGSQIGLRLAIRGPARIAGLIVQNGDIYEDALGPQYDGLLDYFRDPSPEKRQKLVDAVSKDGFREEFLNHVSPEVAARIPPDLWTLHWPLMDTPERRALSVALMEGLKANLDWFGRYQAYLRTHQPPTLMLWGPRDGYMPEASGRAWLRDLPDAELHMFDDGGHWLLETHLDAVAPLIRDFLGRVASAEEPRIPETAEA